MAAFSLVFRCIKRPPVSTQTKDDRKYWQKVAKKKRNLAVPLFGCGSSHRLAVLRNLRGGYLYSLTNSTS